MNLDNVVGGTVRGLSAAALAGTAVLIGRGGRPLVKQALKGYLRGRELAAEAVERLQELSAEASEQLQDIYAEAQAELEQPLDAEPTAPTEAPLRLHPESRARQGER
jgi:exonuclease VII small subunit